MADDRDVVAPLVNYSDWNINLAGIPGPQGATGPSSIADAPNDGTIYARGSLGWQTGGTFGGNITVKQQINVGAAGLAQNAGLTLMSAVGQNNAVYGMRAPASGSRWAMALGDNSAETGSNAGSDFSLLRFDDTGAYVGTPFRIFRSSGRAQFNPDEIGTDQQISIYGPNPVGSGAARIWYIVPTVKTWSAGGVSTGDFNISDETGGSTVLNLAYAGSGRPSVFAGGLNVTGPFNALTQSYCYGGGWNYPTLQGGHYFGFSWGLHVAGLASISVDTGGAYYAIASGSDERLKQDIAPSTYDCLAALQAIPLYEFRWKDHTIPGEPVPVGPEAPLVPAGFVAQRLYEVHPHLVTKGNEAPLRSKAEREAINARKGKEEVLEGGNFMWDIEKNNTIALLVGAVQQLTARVETLEAALAARQR